MNLAKSGAIATVALAAMGGCGSSDEKVDTSSPTVSAAAVETQAATPTADAETPTPEATTVDFTEFEAKNAIPTSDWYPLITSKEIKLGSLWVYTSIVDDADAAEVGSRICGAYSLYALEDPEVDVVFVRAVDGMRIAKCGPGA